MTLNSKTTEPAKKIILITGANSGIGFELANDFVKSNHHVVMICRDQVRGELAKENILTQYPNASLDLVLGDLSTIKATNKLATELTKSYPTIDILIHNAGIWNMKREMNEDGLEETFMVNYLAMFMLNYYLLPNLLYSSDPRIILVNAGLYVNGTFDPAKTPYGFDFSRIRTYADSKFCGILYLTSFTKFIQGSKFEPIVIYGLHPGVFRTNLGLSHSFLSIFIRFAKLFMKSSKKAVSPIEKLCFGDKVKKFPNGQYFDVFKPKDKVPKALDEDLASALWQMSEKFSDLDWNNLLEK